MLSRLIISQTNLLETLVGLASNLWQDIFCCGYLLYLLLDKTGKIWKYGYCPALAFYYGSSSFVMLLCRSKLIQVDMWLVLWSLFRSRNPNIWFLAILWAKTSIGFYSHTLFGNFFSQATSITLYMIPI